MTRNLTPAYLDTPPNAHEWTYLSPQVDDRRVCNLCGIAEFDWEPHALPLCTDRARTAYTNHKAECAAPTVEPPAPGDVDAEEIALLARVRRGSHEETALRALLTRVRHAAAREALDVDKAARAAMVLKLSALDELNRRLTSSLGGTVRAISCHRARGDIVCRLTDYGIPKNTAVAIGTGPTVLEALASACSRLSGKEGKR